VGVVIRLRVRRFWVRIPVGTTDFSLLQTSRPTRCSVPRDKTAWREANHSPPSSAEVMNEWRYSFFPIFALKAWTGTT
jgi:hypothetical protein